MLKEYKLKVFYTEEDYISDADILLEDVFHSDILYTERAWDLMYRNFAYRIEVYEKEDLFRPIRVFNFKDFNRKEYKNSFGSKGEYGTEGLWRTQEEEDAATPQWMKDKRKYRE